jgi:hypothetical protein
MSTTSLFADEHDDHDADSYLDESSDEIQKPNPYWDAASANPGNVHLVNLGIMYGRILSGLIEPVDHVTTQKQFDLVFEIVRNPSTHPIHANGAIRTLMESIEEPMSWMVFKAKMLAYTMATNKN